MDKEDKDKVSKEAENMQTFTKEQGYKGLSLSSKKLKEITISNAVFESIQFENHLIHPMLVYQDPFPTYYNIRLTA